MPIAKPYIYIYSQDPLTSGVSQKDLHHISTVNFNTSCGSKYGTI